MSSTETVTSETDPCAELITDAITPTESRSKLATSSHTFSRDPADRLELQIEFLPNSITLIETGMNEPEAGTDLPKLVQRGTREGARPGTLANLESKTRSKKSAGKMIFRYTAEGSRATE
jgi:hypothetical protein